MPLSHHLALLYLVFDACISGNCGFISDLSFFMLSEFIYCDADMLQPQPGQSGSSNMPRQSDGQYEIFAHLETTVKQNIRNFSLDEKSGLLDDKDRESLIAGALTMALCYANR